MKSFIFLIALFFAWVVIAQQNLNDDIFKIGKKGSTAPKSLIFKSSGNASLTVDNSTDALSFDKNLFSIGNGSAATDKKLIFNTGVNSPSIRLNSSNGKLEFSNDNSIFKAIGSGSGSGDSGINLLKNSSFEDGYANWTSSTGTYTIESYASGSEGDLKYAKFTATSASQTFCSDLATTPSYFGAGGMFDFTYTGTGTSFLAYVVDGSGNKLTSPQALLNQTAWTKLSPIPFSFNTSQKLCFESASAGEIKIDKAYLGSNKNTAIVNQSKYIGRVVVSGCSALLTTSTSYVDLANTGCLYSVSGDLLAPSSAIGPAFKIVPKQSGYYSVSVFGATMRYSVGGTGSAGVRTRLTDGTSFSYIGSIATSTDIGQKNIPLVHTSSFYLSKGNSSEFRIQPQIITSGTGGIEIDSGAGLTFDVYFTPDSASEVQTPEASQWFIDANIGGGNPAFSSAAISSYTQIGVEGLTLTTDSSKGSASAYIPCDSGDSSGSSCPSTLEVVGVSFVNPYAGLFEACFDFSVNATSGNTQTMQVIQTSNTDYTSIIQEGGAKVISFNSYSMMSPYKLCGTFKFSDASKKTIRLMYEKTAGASAQIIADRSAAEGQRDIHVTVRPLLQNSLRATLTGDQVTSSGAKNPKHFSAFIINGTNTVKRTVGDWISSITNSSTVGMSYITLKPNVCSVAPICTVTCNRSDATDCLSMVFGDPTTSLISVNTGTRSTANGYLWDYSIMCDCL